MNDIRRIRPGPIVLCALVLATLAWSVAQTDPANSTTEEVTFANGDVTLAGTLTIPEGAGPHPAVILVSGSGPQNRDGELPGIDGYRPFAELAAHLSARGYAVLRYDDRGVAASSGEHASATSTDFAADAEAALRFLRARPDIDAARVGLLGHSEGGMIAPMVAARGDGGNVAFVVALAPPVGDPLEGLVLQEQRMLEAAGLPPEAVEDGVAMTRRALELTRAEDWPALERFLREMVREQLAALPEEQRERFGDPDTATEQLVAQTMVQYRGWMHTFLAHDAQRDWARLGVPALAVFGGRDVQVDEAFHRAALEEAVAGRDDVEIATLPVANHLFQNAETGGVQEYAELSPGLAPELLRAVTDWLDARVVAR